MLRTHTCGELNDKSIGKKIKLAGWVNTRRDHGGLIFVDLRDRYGLTQIVFDPKNGNSFKEAEKLRREDVIQVTGKVVARKKGMANPKLATGKIEVEISSINVLNKSETPPIEIDDNKEANEEIRLKYRYLDLRRPEHLENFIFKQKIVHALREYLNTKDFLDVDTPMLARSTPEGARDFLVPSRLHKGEFYALPQSPQVYKQTLMVSGFDRYYQLAKCLRDEDLRGDRQPEFTQLDLEMSFITKVDIQELFERMLKYVFKKVMNIDLQTPFPHMSYKDSMENYKCDKPDIRKDKSNKEEFAFVWVDNFPLFEFNETEQRVVSAHHPFTQATEEDWKKLDSCKTKEDYLSLYSESFDLVLNGVELGSGGMRIYKPEKQKQIFNILEKMGYEWFKDCVHVAHGLYLDSDGKKFATRKGKTVYMLDILKEVIKKAEKNILERENIPKKKLEKRAKKIALEAIFYGDLKTNLENNIIFAVDKFLSFEGDTGPYLYTVMPELQVSSEK